MSFILGLIIVVALGIGWGRLDRWQRSNAIREAKAATGRDHKVTQVHWFGTSWALPEKHFLVRGFTTGWFALFILTGLLVNLVSPGLGFVLWLAYFVLAIGFTFGHIDCEPLATKPAHHEPGRPPTPAETDGEPRSTSDDWQQGHATAWSRQQPGTTGGSPAPGSAWEERNKAR